MKRTASLLLVLCFLLSLPLHASASGQSIPAPQGDLYVQDTAHVLSAAEKNELLSLGRALEDKTSAQLAVLTVPSIGEMNIDDYSNKAYRAYKLGTKKQNNGVLLVLAVKEKKIRIEVGYGLEGAITDGKAGRIIDEDAIPSLQAGKTGEAITKTYRTLAKEISKEYSGEKKPEPKEKTSLPWWAIILIVLLIFLDIKFLGGFFTFFLLSLLRNGGNDKRNGGGGSSGGGGAGRGW
ncbi:hypothetical protein A374_11025 [Fictibacillus macauensis ZFHKF-1]|uniref:TPM domain-containing protein n=1 Tax=Fictibacillus macauensis ZFHKF-1 TaxID=1196324 RepID=I8J0J1_9BACL|nr:TPM domain-containing protein [Fictibacillus macauensis]EIT85271.1 hypothetical protein A374_11025 [Fictibacillus macauensis ZFHKF-1]